ncbi:MAG: tape measure protein [Bacteroides sp.]|nr:tape measure protein [Bacteroides sp.]
METNELNPSGWIDPAQFRADAEAVRSGLESNASAASITPLAASIGSSNSSTSSSGSSSSHAAAVFSTKEVKEFLAELIKVNAQYDKLSKSLTALIGNKSEADKVLAQVKELAATTLLHPDELSQAAKSLTQYSLNANELNQQLRMLGEVSSGASLSLKDMTNYYLQMSQDAGKIPEALIGMASEGIPIYEELAKSMQKSHEKIKEIVTAGQIGFPHIQNALQQMTASGGVFENSLQKQARSFSSLFSDLQKGWDTLVSNIAGPDSPLLSGHITNKITDQYSVVGKALGALTQAQSIYKSAQAASHLMENKGLQSKLAHLGATKLLTGAQTALNTVIKLHPYAKVVGVLMNLLSVTSKLNQAKAEEKEAMQALIGPLKEEYIQVNLLVDKLKNANLQEKERTDVLHKLKELNPEIARNLRSEAMNFDTLNGNLEQYNELMKVRIALEQMSISGDFRDISSELQEARNTKRDTMQRYSACTRKFSIGTKR